MKTSLQRPMRAFFVTLPLIGLGVTALAVRSGAAHSQPGNVHQLATTASSAVDEIALSRGGSVVAAIGRDDARFARYGTGGFVYTWDAHTLQRLATIPAPSAKRSGGDLFAALTLAPDGKRLGVSQRSAHGFAVYDTSSQKRLWHVPSWASHAEFSADGRFVALVGNLSGFEYRDAATGKLVSHCSVDHAVPIRTFRLSPDGQTLAWITNPHPQNAAVELRRIRDWKLVGTLPGGMESQIAKFSPSGKQVLLLSRGNTPVDSVTSGTVVGTSYGVEISCFSLSGHLMWQRDSQSSKALDLSGEDFCDAAFAPDGRTIALRDAGDVNGLLIVDATDGHEVRRLAGSSALDQLRDSSVAYSADGKRVFGRGGNGVMVWDLA